MENLSQREINGFLSEKHVEEILSRRELINGCSIEKPYIQDGQVFTLKLENGLIMKISKDLIISLRELIRREPYDSFMYYEPVEPNVSSNFYFLPSGRDLEVNGERVIVVRESNDTTSFIIELGRADIKVSKQLVKSLSDMIDPDELWTIGYGKDYIITPRPRYFFR